MYKKIVNQSELEKLDPILLFNEFKSLTQEITSFMFYPGVICWTRVYSRGVLSNRPCQSVRWSVSWSVRPSVRF